MKKTILKLTSAALALAVTAMSLPMTVGASATKGDNLIANNDPGFDTRTVSSTTLANAPFGADDKNWISRGTAVVDNTHARSGSNSIKITGSSSTGPRAVLTGLTEGKKYWVSAWVYTEEGGKFMRLGVQGSSSSYTSDSYLTKYNWTQIGGVIEAPAGGDAATKGTTGIEGAWALFVKVGNGSIGDFWVDDFEICEVTSDATPAVTASGNVLGSNAGFESGDKTSWRDSSPAYYVKKSSVDANSGEYAAHTTRRSASYNSPQIFVEDANLDDDTYYYASAMVRQGSPSASEVQAFMRMETQTTDADGNTITGTAIPAPSNRTTINTSTYTKVASVFKNVDAKRVKVYVNTNESATTEGQLVDLWTDDYVLAPITSSVANGTTGVTPNTSITFTVPSDITVDAATLTINNSAAISSITPSGTTYTVVFENMLYDTEYTVELNTGLNQNPKWTFKTESKNILGEQDPGFEAKTADDTLESNAFNDRKWISRGTAVVDGTVAHTGTKSVKVSGMSGPRAIVDNADIDEGSKYYGSVWVYTDTADVKLKIGFGGTNGWSSATTLNSGEWTKVGGFFTAGAGGDAAVSATYADITDAYALYLSLEGSTFGTIWVDDFELYKSSDVTVTADLNGATEAAVDSDLVLVFSDEVNLTSSNLSINNGASIADVQTTDNITYTVDLGTLDDFTTYTVSVKDLFDANYDRVKDAEFTFITASATPGAVPNLVSSSDPGFEGRTVDGAQLGDNPFGDTNWLSRGTAVISDTYAHTGTKSAKVTSGSGPRAAVYGLTEGNQYFVSVWVYTPDTGATCELIFGGSTNTRTAKPTLEANTWTQLSGVLTAPAAGDAALKVTHNKTAHTLYISGADFTELYIDDFEISPYTETDLSATVPAAGDTNVRIKTPVSVTFTNALDEGQAFADKFTVTGMTVTGATLQEDKKTVVLTLNSDLAEMTQYTVNATGLKDRFGETVADKTFTFTTGTAVAVIENAIFKNGGIVASELTPGGSIDIAAKIANDGSASVSKPVMIAAFYDAAGYLVGAQATAFGETLASGEADLALNNISVPSSTASVTVHIWRAANNISYMSSPATLTAD